MRPPGRALAAAAAGFLYITFVHASVNDYGIPIEIKVWDTGRTPLAHMVDVTNGFGLRVLAEHNFLNDNNIAFSPYGLMGILVALYEGVDGESSYQIQRAMQLPWNRNVMRIGFRDIHRTLKTYFVPDEGFLAGLALNNDNVTFNEGYKKILRFYGFDLENDHLPTLPPSNSTVNDTTTTSPLTVAPTTQIASTQVREETTTNPNAETIITSTMSPSSASKAESDTTSAPTTRENTEAPQAVVTERSSPSLTTEQTTTTTIIASVVPETTTALPDETETVTSTISSAPTAALTKEPTANNEVEVISTQEIPNTPETTTITNESTMSESVSSTANTSEIPQSSDMTFSTAIPTLGEVTMALANESTLETLQRRKKSIVDFIFNNPPYVDDYLFYRSYDIPIPESTSGFGGDMFLVNGLRNVQVSYMHYNTVLEHAYLPHLEAAAVRLPLDSDRYYLLVVLPLRPGAPELGKLLARMARESDLSDVYSALRPARVRVTVPSFTVKGHVTLTTDLQKLGIRDVFEPRQRDFTPMTRQPGAYVRSIEQAVSVAIREYRPAATAADHSTNRYVANRQPVTFSATYPFLYFVMDSSIHVALMAGKMVDPLNTRIL